MNNKWTFITVLLLALFVINFISKKLFIRFDLTQNKEFTLSKATKDILAGLDEKVDVIAYFSDDLPTELQNSRNDFEDILSEFANRSGGNVTYKFVAPNTDPKLAEEANKEGVQPIMVNVREKDQAKQQKAYLGAVIKVGDEKEIIPIVQPGLAMEYSLTTGIKKMVAKNKPFIGFVQGHGEPPLQELSQVYESLSILYKAQSVYLNNDTIDLKMFKTIVLLKPNDTLSVQAKAKLDQYLAQGGNLIVAYNEVDLNQQYGFFMATSNGIRSWLETKGVSVESKLVRDVNCGSIQVPQNNGFFSMNIPVQLPYLPIIQKFGVHPITKGLEQVILQFASPVSVLPGSNLQYTSLLNTSEFSASDTLPTVLDIQKQWNRNEFTSKGISVGGIFEGKFNGDTPGKLIVFSDGDFPISGKQGRGVNEDNISLLVNSIDWCSDDTGLIDLRTKAVSSRPIQELTDAKRSSLKYINFLLPIGLVLAYAFFRTSLNRRKRMERMEQRFV